MVSAGGERVRLETVVEGRVQGVGFRYWARSRARELGLAGSAENLPDGRVRVVVEGPREAATTFLEALRGPEAPGRVRGVRERWAEPSGITGFQVR